MFHSHRHITNKIVPISGQKIHFSADSTDDYFTKRISGIFFRNFFWIGAKLRDVYETTCIIFIRAIFKINAGISFSSWGNTVMIVIMGYVHEDN